MGRKDKGNGREFAPRLWASEKHELQRARLVCASNVQETRASRDGKVRPGLLSDASIAIERSAAGARRSQPSPSLARLHITERDVDSRRRS